MMIVLCYLMYIISYSLNHNPMFAGTAVGLGLTLRVHLLPFDCIAIFGTCTLTPQGVRFGSGCGECSQAFVDSFLNIALLAPSLFTSEPLVEAMRSFEDSLILSFAHSDVVLCFLIRSLASLSHLIERSFLKYNLTST